MSVVTLFFALISTLPAASDAAERPVILDFTATWCGPCKSMKQPLARLEREGYPIKAVDIDQAPDLAEKYQVTGVPTFIVVEPDTGREIARVSGARPAEDIATLYNQAVAKANRHAPSAAPAVADNDDKEDAEADAKPRNIRRVNPEPWETVVRIKVFGRGSIGFGSGTIISSTPEESIILTCAHIFKSERGPQTPPSQFRRKIAIDLFDGVRSGPKRNQVHYSNETFDGEAIDYDFSRDVGLIRIRPGRRLPYAKVVPPHWSPKPRFGMITVGCSHGQDATAWNTMITNPSFRGLAGQPAYEAVECSTAPSEGRSGGGLFTTDGYVAGVCDFAEPTGNKGLYATPRSIYHILDRNNLMALYSPTRAPNSSPLMADRGANRGADGVRLQSPGRDDPGAAGVTLPPPALLGIKPPTLASAEARARSRASRRVAGNARARRTARRGGVENGPVP